MNAETSLLEPVEAGIMEAIKASAARPSGAVRSAVIHPPVEAKTFGSIFTMVIWMGCLLIGTLGFALPYDRPHKALVAEQPAVELINVELADNSPPDQTPSAQPVTASDLPAQPEIPQPMAVAQPSLAVAFAVPVEGPARIVDVSQAVYRKSAAPLAMIPSPQRLVLGEGEGRQQKPEYPQRARREGQEGTVLVRMVVDESGRVTSVEASTPSPWPLLNESAVRTVRNYWHFAPGHLRAFEVAIRFQLSNRT